MTFSYTKELVITEFDVESSLRYLCSVAACYHTIKAFVLLLIVFALYVLCKYCSRLYVCSGKSSGDVCFINGE